MKGYDLVTFFSDNFLECVLDLNKFLEDNSSEGKQNKCKCATYKY